MPEQLIPQPHGGALKPRHAPANGGSSFKAAKKRALQLLGEYTEDAVAGLKAMMASEDPRVALMATIQVLDRTLGKPGEYSQTSEETGGMIDVSRLSPEQQEELAGALATVRRLAALAQGIVDV